MRYYTSTSGEMVLQSGITGSDTTITVDTTAGLPGSYPYTLILDYGTASEEFVDVTAAASTTLTVTRGQDGSVAQAHAFGAKIRHGITARDLRESREHEAATDAHGVGEVVGTTETQTLDNKTFEPDADHVPLTLRARSGNTVPLVDIQDSTSTQTGSIDSDEIKTFSGATAMLTAYMGGAINLFKQVLAVAVKSDIHAIVGSVVTGATGRFLRLMSGATELFYVSAGGVVGSKGAIIDGDASVSGTLSGPTVTALQAADTALDGRVDALEAANADTRLDAIEANLGSQTTFAATSSTKDTKRVHWGAATVTPGGTGYVTVTHGAGFTPTTVVATSVWVNTAVDPDSITATTFEVRILKTDMTSPAAPTKMTFFCGE